MGEMQGALARARLESLLRPRHKKRAEAQKRSESFLLTGLGKPGPRGLLTGPLAAWLQRAGRGVGEAAEGGGMGTAGAGRPAGRLAPR